MNTEAGRWPSIVLFAMFTLALAASAITQDAGRGSTQRFSPGQNAVVQGVIVKQNADGFTMRDFHGSVIEVGIAPHTDVKERKSNPFRKGRNYGVTELLRGLEVEVKGHGSNSGTLTADQIRITQESLRIAGAMDARVNPVETRVSANETRLIQNEENALRLSGQVSELSAVSNAARGGARAAQESADKALESARTANEEAKGAKAGVRAVNERITALDDFNTKTSLTVNFKAGSSLLSTQTKAELDRLAETAKNEKGCIIEVAGFASADGSQAANRVLSQKRADAVIRYMVENHSIPLRRFITPFGYGDKMPVADNKTRNGRVQNRRVEVRVLVSKGFAQPASSAVAMN